jgi:hypothetical protein
VQEISIPILTHGLFCHMFHEKKDLGVETPMAPPAIASNHRLELAAAAVAPPKGRRFHQLTFGRHTVDHAFNSTELTSKVNNYA